MARMTRMTRMAHTVARWLADLADPHSVYRKISHLSLSIVTSLSLGQYGKVSFWDFPTKTLRSVNKYQVC